MKKFELIITGRVADNKFLDSVIGLLEEESGEEIFKYKVVETSTIETIKDSKVLSEPVKKYIDENVKSIHNTDINISKIELTLRDSIEVVKVTAMDSINNKIKVIVEVI